MWGNYVDERKGLLTAKVAKKFLDNPPKAENDDESQVAWESVQELYQDIRAYDILKNGICLFNARSIGETVAVSHDRCSLKNWRAREDTGNFQSRGKKSAGGESPKACALHCKVTKNCRSYS